MTAEPFDPGPLADVAAHRDGDRWTLVFTRELRHPQERVWTALTDPEQLGQWAPFITDRALDSPGEATLTMLDGDTRVAMNAVVRQADPPKVLEYTWGDDLLRWELSPTPTGTRLVLRHTVQGEDWLAKVAAGWHLCLVVADRLLAGEPIPPIRGEAAKEFGWSDLADGYGAALDA